MGKRNQKWSPPEMQPLHGNGRADLVIKRQNKKSGTWEIAEKVRCGPNHFHALITHPDGTYTDCGVSRNLLTNIGRDWWAQSWGFIGAGVTTASPASAVSTSAVTVTGTPLTASNLATPQLGVAGMRVWMPVTNITTAPVYANIISNTTSVLTIDQWWTVADGTGTTPASTNALHIAPGGIAAARFIALTTDSGAAAASDTVLTSEITTSGCGRALGTYAHTYGASTLTLTKAFSVTGTLTAIHKAGLFSSLTQGGTTAALGGPMLYSTVLNVDATVANGDTLTCLRGDTQIITRSGNYALRDLAGREIEVMNRFGQWEAATVKSFGVQRLHRVEFAHMNPVFATADHRWWQRDGTRVPTAALKRVPFTQHETAHAEVRSITDTKIDEEVFCAVVPNSESFTLANGLLTSNCTWTFTLSG